MAHVLSGQPCCPNCGARAAAQAEVCAECGCRFLEDRARRPRVRPLPLAAAVAVVALGCTAWLISRGDGDADDARAVAAPDARSGPDVLARHPLSTRAVERRLEARFIGVRDDESAAVLCSALQPRPAHAIRHCRIRYPGGVERRVVVLTNPQGRELLIDP